MLAPWKKSYDQHRQHIKRQRHYFASQGPSSQSYDFPSSYVWMWELDYKESWASKNWCFWIAVLEKTLESPLDIKQIQPVKSVLNVHWKDWCWSWNSNTLVTWCEELTHWEKPWCWERLKAGGEGDRRRWDGWVASSIQWTWVWVISRSWWWTGRPGVLQSMGLQGVRHNWATELNWKLPDVQTGFRKGGGTRDQIANVNWILEKAREFQQNIYTPASLTILKPLTVWIMTNCGKS